MGEKSSKSGKGFNAWHMTGKERVSFPGDPGSYLDHHHISVATVCFNEFFSGTKKRFP